MILIDLNIHVYDFQRFRPVVLALLVFRPFFLVPVSVRQYCILTLIIIRHLSQDPDRYIPNP